MSALAKIAARLRPLGNRVLVHKRALDNVSAGGKYRGPVCMLSTTPTIREFASRSVDEC